MKMVNTEAFKSIIGRSPALSHVLRQAEIVAPVDTNVLIMGETGTGKELLAQAIHNLSTRRNRPLIKVNCAALPASLAESELFGHEKGAFTDAYKRRPGRFEIADGGTILLDEIGELPLELQPKLLRILEHQEFERVGGMRTINVDVRVIASTNRNLKEAVTRGLFRGDLYYRLSSFPITLPPLRERQEDIPILIRHFVAQLGSKLSKQVALTEETLATLCAHDWPGNVRELRNVSERLVIAASNLNTHHSPNPATVVITSQKALLERDVIGEKIDDDEETTIDQVQYELIVRTLRRTKWLVDGPFGAAAILKINPSTLRSRMKKLGINRPRVSD